MTMCSADKRNKTESAFNASLSTLQSFYSNEGRRRSLLLLSILYSVTLILIEG